MKVLIDTCIWSQGLRHKAPNFKIVNRLKDLIDMGRVAMIGPIRQELLSGISNAAQFKKLKEKLSFFEDIPLETEYFTKAAEFSNACRNKGIQGSTTDFLICAIAHLDDFFIFTVDSDFESYKKYLPIKLF